MKKQIISIHGGSTYDSYKEYLSHLKSLEIDIDRYRRTKWRDILRKDLGKDFDVLLPIMPNGTNAKYKEWEIIFRKIANLLENNVVLMGHSLGAIFLAKYLSENKFPKKILATILISGPYDDKGMGESLGDFTLPKSLDKLNEQGGKILLYQSEDDPIVPYAHVEKYKKALPSAILRRFKKKGHFNQPSFPELIRDIKGLYQR